LIDIDLKTRSQGLVMHRMTRITSPTASTTQSHKSSPQRLKWGIINFIASWIERCELMSDSGGCLQLGERKLTHQGLFSVI
jgi:hypothetical protein